MTRKHGPDDRLKYGGCNGPDGVVGRHPRGASISHPSKLELSRPKLWLGLDAAAGMLSLVACTRNYLKRRGTTTHKARMDSLPLDLGHETSLYLVLVKAARTKGATRELSDHTFTSIYQSFSE